MLTKDEQQRNQVKDLLDKNSQEPLSNDNKSNHSFKLTLHSYSLYLKIRRFKEDITPLTCKMLLLNRTSHF